MNSKFRVGDLDFLCFVGTVLAYGTPPIFFRAFGAKAFALAPGPLAPVRVGEIPKKIEPGRTGGMKLL